MNDKNSPIGIFDSGLGGLSVLVEILKVLPRERFVYYADSGFAPYGHKSREEIKERCYSITEILLKRGVKALVVACNTATSSAVEDMRRGFSIPIVGMEPALKPAYEANLPGKILVLGTPFTINEPKYQNLLKRFISNKEIVSLPCPGLVELIEKGDINSPELKSRLKELFRGLAPEEFSCVVLGCTHFIYLKSILREIIGAPVQFFDGNFGTARQLKRVLKQYGSIRDVNEPGNPEDQIVIDTSANPGQVIPLCHKLLSMLSDAEK
ncbi:glutamate racemase [Candidatus Sumerlaeota bacterium]|nr:glutamate racemase [Candidatus Sumerlaeota bacterium]